MQKNLHINAAWHQKNRMPENATIEQRIAWHLEHLKHCQCRKQLPENLLREMKKRGLRVPVMKATDHKQPEG